MSNLISLENAAKMLGLSVDKLNEYREDSEIFGYKDGANWKFKMNELQRFAENFDINMGSLDLAGGVADAVKGKVEDAADAFGGGLSSLADDAGLSLDDDEESSVFGSSLSGKSEDSSLSLDEGSSLSLEGSSLNLEGSSLSLDGSGSLKLDEGSELKLDGSSLNLEGSALDLDGSSLDLDGGSSLSLEGSSLNLEGSSLKLDGSSLSLESSGLDLDGSGLDLDGSGLNLDGSSLDLDGSALNLEDSGQLLASDTGDLLDEVKAGSGDSPSDTGAGGDMFLSGGDDELLLDDSASGIMDDSGDLVLDDDGSSEIMFDASDSGIALGISESGINLSDSMELGGSGIDVLDLPDDDDVIMVDDASPDEATSLQEGAFNLTPLEEADEVDGSDSQIIALDDSGIYADESEAVSILESSEGDMALQPQMLPDDGPGVGFGPSAVAAPGMVQAIPEAPYSVWQVASLFLAFAILALGGMIAYDLCRNLWIPRDQIVNSGVLKFVLSLVGLG